MYAADVLSPRDSLSLALRRQTFSLPETLSLALRRHAGADGWLSTRAADELAAIKQPSVFTWHAPSVIVSPALSHPATPWGANKGVIKGLHNVTSVGHAGGGMDPQGRPSSPGFLQSADVMQAFIFDEE